MSSPAVYWPAWQEPGFSLETVGAFDDMMTGGKGFIALAAMIFGKWKPFGAFGGALLFGFVDALQIKLQIVGINMPYQFLSMAPYVVTMIVLAGFIGRCCTTGRSRTTVRARRVNILDAFGDEVTTSKQRRTKMVRMYQTLSGATAILVLIVCLGGVAGPSSAQRSSPPPTTKCAAGEAAHTLGQKIYVPAYSYIF